MKKCLHVLFMIAALSLTFAGCANQVDENDDKTEEVKQPEAQTPEGQDPQGQTTDPNQGKDPNKDSDPNQGKDPNQQQDPAPVFDRYEFAQLLITRTEGLNAEGNDHPNYTETALDDFIKKPVKSYVEQHIHSGGPEPYYVGCTLTYGGGDPLKCKIKVRGNWTTSYGKKSLRIKFDKKQNILGLHGGEKYKNWVLLAGFKDASFLRDAAGFALFKEMFPDYYCSDFRLVEVLLKTDNLTEPENLGIYLLAEQQEGKTGRINITEADKANQTDTNIGYIIEMDSYSEYEDANQQFTINNYGDILTYNGKKAGGLTTGYTIKNDIYSAQRKFIEDYMRNLWTICYNAAYKQKYYRFNTSYALEEYTPEGETDDEKAKNCVAEVIDLVSLANTYIFSEITCDPDLYYSSFYMDIDFSKGDHKLRFEAPWDFDSTMGNKKFCSISNDNFNDNSTTVPFTINSMYAGNGQPDVNGNYSGGIRVNPWLVVFIRSVWFQQLVKDQWQTIDTSNLKSEVSTVLSNYTSTEYTEAFNNTRKKWGWYKDGELNENTLSKANASQLEAAAYLKVWLFQRIDAVNTIITNLQPQNN